MAAGKELHVGLTDEYPPLSYVDANGQRRGFEFDLAADLCRRLGRTCVWTCLLYTSDAADVA